jgi:hypothetical protein
VVSQVANITVAKIETKPTARGSIFKIWDQSGNEYATFDGGVGNLAMQYLNKAAAITFTEKSKEKDGRVYTDRYLDSIEVAPEGAPISSRTPEGTADWDVIGFAEDAVCSVGRVPRVAAGGRGGPGREQHLQPGPAAGGARGVRHLHAGDSEPGRRPDSALLSDGGPDSSP